MTNETTIKVPKKYHFMIKSIRVIYDIFGKYAVTFQPGFYDVTDTCFSESQADVLEFIRLTYQIYMEDRFVSVPEETIAKEGTTNVDTNDTVVPVEQGHVPSALAVDAPEIAPDQEATAPVVDDWRLVYVVVESQHPDGYPMVNIHCVSRRYAQQKFMSSTCYPIHADARNYAQAVLATLDDNATFHDCALQMLDKYAASG